MTLTELTAVAGLIFGVVGAVLGVMSFMRDRVALDVALHWDWAEFPPDPSNPDRKIAVVKVQNIGRRPVYVSNVSISTGGRVSLMLKESMDGVRLAEGDAPLILTMRQEGLDEYARNWWLLRAQVCDSTGRVWKSPMLKGKPPSWAKAAESI